MEMEIERRLKLQDMGTMLPFAVISLKTEKAVGMTTYMLFDTSLKDWIYSTCKHGMKSVQYMSLNTECKITVIFATDVVEKTKLYMC